MEFKLDVFNYFVAQQSVYRKDLFLQICRMKIYTKYIKYQLSLL